MEVLASRVMEYVNGLSEGTPVAAKELLHLGRRAAVDQALSRLVRRASLMRAGRGIYIRPVESRFGTRPPAASKVIEGIAAQRGESMVPHGAAAANELGLTTQVPVREMYLTSGPAQEVSALANKWLTSSSNCYQTNVARPSSSLRQRPVGHCTCWTKMFGWSGYSMFSSVPHLPVI